MSTTPNVRLEFSLDRLEQRQMMAGDVSVQVTGGDLRITGDELGNGIEINQVGNGQYRVVGLYLDGSQTTVNGQASFLAQGVSDDFTIRMRGGGDYVRVYESAVNVPDDMRIELGDGNDRVYLDRLSVGDDLTILGQEGNDVFYINRLDVGTQRSHGDFQLNMGDGINIMEVYGASIRRNTTITGGRNEDFVEMAWNDFGNDLNVNTRQGIDSISMHASTVDDDLTITSGSGGDARDHLGLDNLTIGDRLLVRTGSGGDSLQIHTTTAARASFIGGSGNDILRFTDGVAFGTYSSFETVLTS